MCFLAPTHSIDVGQEEAFVEHVKDVDAIAHTASPFHMRAIEPEELIKPAVEGTLSVLKAAAAHGRGVKRVIVLSSTAAVVRDKPNGVLDESSWNEDAIAEVNEKGREATPGGKYRASKTLAERAAWEWYGARKAELSWDLIALNPPFVFGPTLHEIPTLDQLNTSSRLFYDNVVKSTLDNEALVTQG